MSKVFVIPDVHLKPWMFEQAGKIIEKNAFDQIVLLGDLVDDWNQQENVGLYQQTLDAALDFVNQYAERILFCIGNHDISYLWQEYETGYSIEAGDIVRQGINKIMYALPEGSSGFIHRVDNVLFSHAGLTQSFVIKTFGQGGVISIDEMIASINRMGSKELWNYDSPIWARPQYGRMRLYPRELLQVVGHTPMPKAFHDGRLLSLDTFSTYQDGRPIGEEKFVWVDTVEKKEEYC